MNALNEKFPRSYFDPNLPHPIVRLPVIAHPAPFFPFIDLLRCGKLPLTEWPSTLTVWSGDFSKLLLLPLIWHLHETLQPPVSKRCTNYLVRDPCRYKIQQLSPVAPGQILVHVLGIRAIRRSAGAPGRLPQPSDTRKLAHVTTFFSSMKSTLELLCLKANQLCALLSRLISSGLLASQWIS